MAASASTLQKFELSVEFEEEEAAGHGEQRIKHLCGLCLTLRVLDLLSTVTDLCYAGPVRQFFSSVCAILQDGNSPFLMRWPEGLVCTMRVLKYCLSSICEVWVS